MGNDKKTELKKYIKSLDPNILGFDKIRDLNIYILPYGVWNFNYMAEINKKSLFSSYILPVLAALKV
jgi:hypothetical protein